MIWLATNLVQRKQSIVLIKKRIFKALGHQGCCELLEFQNEIDSIVFCRRRMRLRLCKQTRSDVINFAAQSRIRTQRILYSRLNIRLIALAAAIMVDIGTINRKMRQYLHQGFFQTMNRKIFSMTVAVGKSLYMTSKIIEISFHMVLYDMFLLLIDKIS